jgi:cytochrome c-type biogenesis protein CcmH
MNATLSSVALVLGLVLCALAVAIALRMRGRARRARRREADGLRRQLAALKAERADGKIDGAAYRKHRDELGRQYFALSCSDAASEPAPGRPMWQWLGSAGLACMVLGAGLLIWPLLPSDPAAPTAASAAHPLRTDQVEHAVAQMSERVKHNPKDANAWAMLAHSYDMLGRRVEASAAYARLIELVPDNPEVLVDAADAMALANGRRFEGEPMKLIQRALALDPKNLKALSLAGTDAFDRNDPARAVSYWQRARALVTDDSLARELDLRIADAHALRSRAQGGDKAASVATDGSSTSGFVGGRIVLSEKLKSRVSPSDTLFVFARPADGSRMPVALMRRQAGEIPLEFRLDDSMAMVPKSRLSGQPRVIVGARISKKADAVPNAGDLEGFSSPVAVGTQGVQVVISEVVK